MRQQTAILESLANSNPQDLSLKGFSEQKTAQVNLLFKSLPESYLKLCTVKFVRRKFWNESFNNPHTICFNKKDVLDLFNYKKNGCMDVKNNSTNIKEGEKDVNQIW